jgi:hypothetical protein
MIKNASNNLLHLTLREMQSGFLNIKFVICMIAAVTILTIAGPFGTLRSFNILERFAYWLILTPITFLIASFCATFIVVYLSKLGSGKWLSHGIAGIAAGIPVGISVWAFHLLLNNQIAPDWNFLSTMISNTIPITFAITMAYASLSQNKTSSVANVKSPKSSDLFFNRLPKKLGRDIISLNAQDHYVEVRTTLGSELILMRMNDAIAELSDHEGLQIHRSWWVARKHVVKTLSRDGKKFLQLTNKTRVPVSRSFSKNIQSLTQK